MDPIAALNDRVSTLEDGFKLYRGRIEGIGKELKVFLAEINIITEWIHERFGIQLLNKNSFLYKHFHDCEEVVEISQALKTLLTNQGSGGSGIIIPPSQEYYIHGGDPNSQSPPPAGINMSQPAATPPPQQTARIRVSSVPPPHRPPSLPPSIPLFQPPPQKSIHHLNHKPNQISSPGSISMSTPTSPISLCGTPPSPPPVSAIHSQLIISKKSKPSNISPPPAVTFQQKPPHQPQLLHPITHQAITLNHNHNQNHKSTRNCYQPSPPPVPPTPVVTIIPAPTLPPPQITLNYPLHSMPPKKSMSKKNAYQQQQLQLQQQQQQQKASSEGNITRYFKPVAILENRQSEEQIRQQQEQEQRHQLQQKQLKLHHQLHGTDEPFNNTFNSQPNNSDAYRNNPILVKNNHTVITIPRDFHGGESGLEILSNTSVARSEIIQAEMRMASEKNARKQDFSRPEERLSSGGELRLGGTSEVRLAQGQGSSDIRVVQGSSEVRTVHGQSEVRVLQDSDVRPDLRPETPGPETRLATGSEVRLAPGVTEMEVDVVTEKSEELTIFVEEPKERPRRNSRKKVDYKKMCEDSRTDATNGEDNEEQGDRDYPATDADDEGGSSDSSPVVTSMTNKQKERDRPLKTSTPIPAKVQKSSSSSVTPTSSKSYSKKEIASTSKAEETGKSPEKLPKRGRPKKKPEERVRTYDPRVPMMCDECGKVLKGSGALRVHKQIHANIRPHECKECGKAFRRKHHLEFHMMIHVGDKKETCTYCGKAFLIRRDLARHERTHTGEKPYGCHLCPKSFNVKQHLTLHIRTHTGERPYKCPICEKTFTQANSLRIHKKIHMRDSAAAAANNAGTNGANSSNNSTPTNTTSKSTSQSNKKPTKKSQNQQQNNNTSALNSSSGISSASTSALETPDRQRAPSRASSTKTDDHSNSSTTVIQQQQSVHMIRVIHSPPLGQAPQQYYSHPQSALGRQYDHPPPVGETVTVVTSPMPAHHNHNHSHHQQQFYLNTSSGSSSGNGSSANSSGVLISPNNPGPTHRLTLNPGSGTNLLHSSSTPPPHSLASPLPAHSTPSITVIRPLNALSRSGGAGTLIRAYIPSQEQQSSSSNNLHNSSRSSSPTSGGGQQHFTIYDPNNPNPTRYNNY